MDRRTYTARQQHISLLMNTWAGSQFQKRLDLLSYGTEISSSAKPEEVC